MIPSISVQGTSTTFVKHSVCDHKLTWNSFEERVRKRRAGTSAWGSLVNVVKYTLGIKNDLVQNLKWQHQTKPLKMYLLFLSKFFFCYQWFPLKNLIWKNSGTEIQEIIIIRWKLFKDWIDLGMGI